MKAFVVFVGACVITCVAYGQDVMTGVRLPLERFESGLVKSQVLAERAHVGADDTVEGEVVRLETFREDGIGELVVTTDRCSFNKARKTAGSTSAVRVEREGATITGVGFDWNGEAGVLRILSDVRVVFARHARAGADSGAGTGGGGAKNDAK